MAGYQFVLGEEIEVRRSSNGSFLGYGWYAGAYDFSELAQGVFYIEVNRYHQGMYNSHPNYKVSLAYRPHYKKHPKYFRVDQNYICKRSGYQRVRDPKSAAKQTELGHSFKVTKTKRDNKSVQVGDLWVRVIEN